jgi:TonB family protein
LGIKVLILLLGCALGFAQAPSSLGAPNADGIKANPQAALTFIDFSVLKVRYQPPTPRYPPLARIANVQGDVVLKITIDAKGRVEQVEPLEGPPVLYSTAVDYYKFWSFEPAVLEGVPARVQSSLRMPFRLTDDPKNEGPGPISHVVLEVELGPADHPAHMDLALIQHEAGQWLSKMGFSLVGPEKADPGRTVHLKLAIQAFHTAEGTFFHNLIERASLLSYRDLAENSSDGPQRIWFFSHVLGQKGENGFQNSFMNTLRRTLQELVLLPGPKRLPIPLEVGRNPEIKSQLAPYSADKGWIVDFDFSQLKVKRQPPAPHYPPYARSLRIQGTVVVEITIDPTGTPIHAEAVAGPTELLMSAIGYALKWEFEPARLNGVPQFARFRLTMPYRLKY